MITQEKAEKLLEKYCKSEHLRFYDYKSDSLASGKEYFHQLLAYIQTKNSDFPNLDFILTDSPDRLNDQNFFFGLCEYSLRFKNKPPRIDDFDQDAAETFYAYNINRFLNGTPLGAMHEGWNNLSIVEKQKHGGLTGAEWLTDVDIAQLADDCGLEDRVITNCNFHEEASAVYNLGVALHFKRKDFLKNPNVEEFTIPLFLETGASLNAKKGWFSSIFNQGSHWTSAVLHVNMKTKEIWINYMNSMYDWKTSSIEKVFRHAVNFTHAERATNGEKIKYEAFPGFKIKINVDDKCLRQHNGWSCGYFAFKNAVDCLPDSNNENFMAVKNCKPEENRLRHPFANKLRDCLYTLLLGVPFVVEELNDVDSDYEDKKSSGYKSSSSSYFKSTPKPAPVDPFKERWDILKTVVLDKLHSYEQDPSKKPKGKCIDLKRDVNYIDIDHLTASQKISRLHDLINPNLTSPEFILESSKKSSKLKSYSKGIFKGSDDFETVLQEIRKRVAEEFVEPQEKQTQKKERSIAPPPQQAERPSYLMRKLFKTT